jgi:predicted glycosyltransferase
MIYSHDTFGLGHIRRARTIANALAGELGAEVIIASGSPVVGSFDYARGIDYVRLPGVVKQPDGNYAARALTVPLDRCVALREALIRQTAESFDPDVLIVDKEPTGFRGEMLPTIEMLRARGTRIVLGVRDVLDGPEELAAEWERKGARAAIIRLYDHLLVYGLPDVYAPLAPLALPPQVEARVQYTGYLGREAQPEPTLARYPAMTGADFLLVTAGGGGDGVALMDWVVSAYESDSPPGLPALLVFGPFIPRAARNLLLDRIARLGTVEALAFEARLEWLMARAAGVVAMGGYNTFCEILSFDRPALIVPRARPRQEQTIRARRAAALGLCAMLEEPPPGAPGDPAVMAAALTSLPGRPRPSEALRRDLLTGVPEVTGLVRQWLENPLPRRRLSAAGG